MLRWAPASLNETPNPKPLLGLLRTAIRFLRYHPTWALGASGKVMGDNTLLSFTECPES